MATFNVSVDSSLRSKFGLSYPVTYEFSIPSGSSGLSAQRMYPEDSWETLTEHAAQAHDFTGTEGVRFDYANDRAYVSAAFTNAASDAELWLRIMDGATEVEATYIGACDYFDNRQSAAIVTYDDWEGEDHPLFMKAALGAQARGVWVSVGIVSNGRTSGHPDSIITAAQWAEMQTAIDGGYIEPNNHTYNHTRAAAMGSLAEVDAEIGACSDDLKANLTLPPQSRMGAEQFVLGFIEPFGAALDPALQSGLVAAGLINQRSYDAGDDGLYDAWNGTVFDRSLVTNKGDDDTSIASQNAKFDAAHAAGDIYHAIYHPWLGGNVERTAQWSPGNTYDLDDPNNILFQHLDYIGGRDDVWYVGWGHLYAYRLTALEATVEVTDAPATGTIEYRAVYSDDDGSTWTIFQDWTAEDLTEALDTTVLPEGELQIQVLARDAANPDDVATSDIVTVTVSHVQYELEGRVDGGELGAWQTIQAWAADRAEALDTDALGAWSTLEVRVRARDAANPSDVSDYDTATYTASAAVTVEPGFIASTAQVFAPTITEGTPDPVAVEPAFIASTAEVYAPELTEGLASGDAVRPSFIASTAQVFEPSVQYGAVTIEVPFIASTSEVFSPRVGVAVELTGPFTVSLAPSRLSVTVHESALTVS